MTDATIEFTEWSVETNDIKRLYRYSGLTESGLVYLQLQCRLERGEILRPYTFFNFILDPFMIVSSGFVAMYFGEENISRPFTTARVTPVHGSDSAALITVTDLDAISHCVGALRSGNPLMLMLLNGTDPEPIARMSVPNDQSFRVAYDNLYKKFSDRPGGLFKRIFGN